MAIDEYRDGRGGFFSGMTGQGVDKSVWDRFAMGGMIAAHASSALIAAEVDTIGRVIAGSGKAGSIDMDLEQERPVTIKRMPLFCQSAGGQGEGLGQLGQAEGGEFGGGLADEFEISRASSGLSQLRCLMIATDWTGGLNARHVARCALTQHPRRTPLHREEEVHA